MLKRIAGVAAFVVGMAVILLLGWLDDGSTYDEDDDEVEMEPWVSAHEEDEDV
jgi:hypothetical protein